MPTAIILGNGPSLADTPWDLLRGQATFACNRINLVYEWTDWRPTYYFAFDWTGSYMLDDTLMNVKFAEQSFIRADRALEIERCFNFEYPSTRTYFRSCIEHVECNYQSAHRPESWHFPKICGYGSTLHIMTQVAAKLGYDSLCYIGCDLGFVSFEEGEPDPNHFHPDYIGVDEFPLETRDETLLHMHGLIENELKSRDIKCFNAGPTSILRVHEVISLTEFVRGTN